MRKIFLFLFLFSCSAAFAQNAAISRSCDLGATPAKVSGMNSTNLLQGIIPLCTVSVYLTGTTTLATIYSDGNNTVLSNPFTASPQGAYTFYAATGQGYDVVQSGGIPPNNYPIPVTITNIFACATGGEQCQIQFGPAGPANTLAIGTVTTGTANATITGTAPNQTLNLTLPPGPPLNFTGPWFNTTPYAKGDGVSFGGSSFVALVPNSGVTPPNTCTSNSTWTIQACEGSTNIPVAVNNAAIGSGTSLTDSGTQAALNNQPQSAEAIPVAGSLASGPPSNTLAIELLGNSTVAVQEPGWMSGICYATATGRPLAGNICRQATAVSCDASSNCVVTIPNGDGFFQVGSWYSGGGSTSNCLEDGPFLITAATTTTVSLNAITSNETCTNQVGVNNNFLTDLLNRFGTSGGLFNAIYTGTFNWQYPNLKVVARQQIAAGKVPVLATITNHINDIRSFLSSGTYQSVVSDMSMLLNDWYANFPGYPVVLIEEQPTQQGHGSGTQYLCVEGTPHVNGCTVNNLTAPASTSGAISAGTNTATLSYCPTSLWSPGLTPTVIGPDGITPYQVILDTTGSGVQETVSLTNLTPVGSSCTVTFTNVNAHASGYQVMTTEATGAIEMGVIIHQAYGTLLGKFRNIVGLPLHAALLTDIAQPFGGSGCYGDQIHIPNCANIEGLILAKIVSSFVNVPNQQLNQTSGYNGIAVPQINNGFVNSYEAFYDPIIDPLFSIAAASATRYSNANQANSLVNNLENGTPPYPLEGEDTHFYDTLAAGMYAPGGSSSTVIQIVFPANQTNSESIPVIANFDKICMNGVGCFSPTSISTQSAGNDRLDFVVPSNPFLGVISSSQNLGYVVQLQRPKMGDEQWSPSYYLNPQYSQLGMGTITATTLGTPSSFTIDLFTKNLAVLESKKLNKRAAEITLGGGDVVIARNIGATRLLATVTCVPVASNTSTLICTDTAGTSYATWVNGTIVDIYTPRNPDQAFSNTINESLPGTVTASGPISSTQSLQQSRVFVTGLNGMADYIGWQSKPTAVATPVILETLIHHGCNSCNYGLDLSGASTVKLPFVGTTGTITGTALSSSCDSGTTTITGATVGSPVTVSSTTGADVGGAFNLRASVTASNTVTVYICGTGTPASLAYNVTVFQ